MKTLVGTPEQPRRNTASWTTTAGEGGSGGNYVNGGGNRLINWRAIDVKQ